MQLRAARVDDPLAHALLTEYFSLRVEGFADRVYNTVFPDPAKFTPPAGVFLIAELDGDPVGCAGIRMLSPVRAELKHLYVRDSARGHGVGGELVAELERRAVELGAAEMVLDTHDSLEAAGRLYARSGYVEIEPYNDNPNASNWYGKGLGRPKASPRAYDDDLIFVMSVLVFDESPLWSVGNMITDHPGDGRTVVHGPFDRSTCSEVLLKWFDRGWVDLIVFTHLNLHLEVEPSEWEKRIVMTERGDYAALSPADARNLLIDPDRWSSATREGGVMLSPSDEGELHSYSEWRDIANS